MSHLSSYAGMVCDIPTDPFNHSHPSVFGKCVTSPDMCAAKGQDCDVDVICCDGEEYNLSNILTHIILFVLLISSHVSSSCVSSLLVINLCFRSGLKCVFKNQLYHECM